MTVLLAAGLPAAPVDADAIAPPCTPRFEPLVGAVCSAPGGLLHLFGSDETVHGIDPPPATGARAARLDAPVLPPVCTDDADTYHTRVLYTHASDQGSRHTERIPELRTMVARMNGLLDTEAAPFGMGAQLRVRCTGDTIDITRVALTTPAAVTTFQTITDELRTRGHDRPNIKYLVWHEGDRCAGGIGSLFVDDRPGPENWNNGHRPMYAVNFGCTGDQGVLVSMHEWAHTMGAVQHSAPNATGAGHCTDGADIMCYDDHGAPAYRPDVCTDRQHFDCNNDDYFHPAPEAGSYLAAHWNIASATNRFIVLEAAGPWADAGPDQTVREDTDGSATVPLDGSASSGKRPLAYRWTHGGEQIADGATPTATFGIGTHTLTLTVTDDRGGSAQDTTTITVLQGPRPIAHAGSDQIVRDSTGAGTVPIHLDGSASSHPESDLTYRWTQDARTLATTSQATIDLPVGTHTLTLTVTDDHGRSDSDSLVVGVLPNRPPVAVAPADIELYDAERSGAMEVALDGSPSYDPDGPLAAYEWHHADGTLLATGATARVTLSAGTHPLTLTVTDPGGLSDSASFQVRISDNRPPVAIAKADCDGHRCTLDGGRSHDPDDDPLSYAWSLGDGKTATGKTHTHDYPDTGHYTACLTVTDDRGLADTDCTQVRILRSIYRQDFTQGAPDWTLTGLWHVTGRCASGTTGTTYLGYHHDLILDAPLGCSYHGLDKTDGDATFSVDLRGASTAKLAFDTRWDTRDTEATSQDRLSVQVKVAHLPYWVVIARWDSRDPNRPGWTTEQLDLDRFAGHEVQVRFRFDSMVAPTTLHQGWAIDHVRIQADVPSG